MTLRPVRLGIIGCGVIGQEHLRAAAVSPLIDVVAVADLQPESARETADNTRPRAGTEPRMGRGDGGRTGLHSSRITRYGVLPEQSTGYRA